MFARITAGLYVIGIFALNLVIAAIVPVIVTHSIHTGRGLTWRQHINHELVLDAIAGLAVGYFIQWKGTLDQRDGSGSPDRCGF